MPPKTNLRLRLLDLRAVHMEHTTPVCKECGGRCCQSCATYEGHFMSDEMHSYRTDFETEADRKAHLAKMKRKYGWSKLQGFLRPTGCALPVEERSNTCLSYVCLAPELFDSHFSYKYHRQVQKIFNEERRNDHEDEDELEAQS